MKFSNYMKNILLVVVLAASASASAADLRAVAGQPQAPPLVGNRHFWRADFMAHHRPGYYASARMHSKRIASTDGPANSEGLLSHHLADGCFV